MGSSREVSGVGVTVGSKAVEVDVSACARIMASRLTVVAPKTVLGLVRIHVKHGRQSVVSKERVTLLTCGWMS
jgi:hypothetical protein